MHASAYVETFTARGVILWREGEALRYKAPPGVLTPSVLEKLREAKPKILPILPSTSVLQLAAVVAWALSEARRGFLPEPNAALTLPSGNVVAANGAAAWMIAAESRSVGLRVHADAFPDCKLALEIIKGDAEFIAIWARSVRLGDQERSGDEHLQKTSVEGDLAESCTSTRARTREGAGL